MTTLYEVKSSNIHAIGYNEESGALHVRFKTVGGNPGPVWSYADVPSDLAFEFRNSPTPGRFFAQNIRNNFKASRVELSGERPGTPDAPLRAGSPTQKE